MRYELDSEQKVIGNKTHFTNSIQFPVPQEYCVWIRIFRI